VNRCVIDASVVTAALLQEKHAGSARVVLTSGAELLAPDLIIAEMGNVIWKRFTRGELDADESTLLLSDCLALPIALTPSIDLIEPALELATRTRRTVYDCLYMALALTSDCTFLTADERLVNSLKTTPLSKYIASIRSAE